MAAPCVENAFLSRSEKTLVLRSTHGGLEIERVAWQMRHLLGLWVAMVGKIFRWRRTLKRKSGPPRGRMIWVMGNLPERPEEVAEGKQGNKGGDEEGKRREIEQHQRAYGRAESALLLRGRLPRCPRRVHACTGMAPSPPPARGPSRSPYTSMSFGESVGPPPDSAMPSDKGDVPAADSCSISAGQFMNF